MKPIFIPTPIGYPVTIRFYAAFEASAFYMIKIKGLSITMAAGGEIAAKLGASGAFEIPYIFEIGVYIEGTIFKGKTFIILSFI